MFHKQYCKYKYSVLNSSYIKHKQIITYTCEFGTKIDASPKSPILTVILCDRSKLLSFKSLWTILLAVHMVACAVVACARERTKVVVKARKMEVARARRMWGVAFTASGCHMQEVMAEVKVEGSVAMAEVRVEVMVEGSAAMVDGSGEGE